MKQVVHKIINPFLIISVAVILRLVPHIPNVAPIAAMALFGGVYVNKRYALIVPIAAMVISDFFLGFSTSTPMVYASFLLIGCIGLLLRSHKRVINIVVASLLSSLLFYLLTNFSVWYATSLYPKTLSGLLACYTMALPFFRNTILGDLFYTGIFFGGYELAVRISKAKKLVLQ